MFGWIDLLLTRFRRQEFFCDKSLFPSGHLAKPRGGIGVLPIDPEHFHVGTMKAARTRALQIAEKEMAFQARTPDGLRMVLVLACGKR